jgi:hypothetical protein
LISGFTNNADIFFVTGAGVAVAAVAAAAVAVASNVTDDDVCLGEC